MPVTLPFEIQVLVETDRYTVVRNVPQHREDPVWYTTELAADFTPVDLEGAVQYLPFDCHCDFVHGEEGRWYADWSTPSGN